MPETRHSRAASVDLRPATRPLGRGAQERTPPHPSPHFLHDGEDVLVCERGGCYRRRSFISAVLARGAPPRTTPGPFGRKSRHPSADPPHPPSPGTAPIPLTSLHFQNEGILEGLALSAPLSTSLRRSWNDQPICRKRFYYSPKRGRARGREWLAASENERVALKPQRSFEHFYLMIQAAA